nr:protein FAR-RED IMPAIRED RESPONSE 1-like [Aegilops tauschii subsp. strangulata]
MIYSGDGILSSMPYIPADVTNLKAKYHRESRLAYIEDTIAYFKEKAKADADFFYRIRLHDEDRVRNMYWVDGATRRAYKHLRDCISFDATYLTNMYKMPCIAEVFPLAVHRHCRWHIIKKAEETLGPFFADRPKLHKAFELCVDHSLTTTQRSKGFNAVLKRYLSPGSSLLQFAKQYTTLQQKILETELHQEANTALKQPELLTYLPMERQMSKIYTNKIFNKFQEEIKRASMYTAYQVDEHTFKVCSLLGMSDSEPEDPDKGRNYFVKASINEGEYYYQCCKFEQDGIVCCHILKVMDMHAVTRLPRHFIRRRWTWDTDDALGPQTSNVVLAVHDERPEATMDAVRHVVLTKNYAELIDEACKSDETARVAEKTQEGPEKRA